MTVTWLIATRFTIFAMWLNIPRDSVVYFKKKWHRMNEMLFKIAYGRTETKTCVIQLRICRWHYDVIKWKHFPRYWPFVRGIHRSPVKSPHTGQWRGALMFSLIYARINGWVNSREAGDLRRHRAHYDVIVMHSTISCIVLGALQT